MDSRSADGSVILLSIHPRYVEAILDGRKRVEFRKSAFQRSVSRVVIYATRPVMKIVGYFEVKEVERASPENVWQRYGEVGSTDEEFFFAYYGSRQSAVAISIGDVTELDRPISLPEIDENMRPPQSFTYLPAGCWDRIARPTCCEQD